MKEWMADSAVAALGTIWYCVFQVNSLGSDDDALYVSTAFDESRM